MSSILVTEGSIPVLVCGKDNSCKNVIGQFGYTVDTNCEFRKGNIICRNFYCFVCVFLFLLYNIL